MASACPSPGATPNVRHLMLFDQVVRRGSVSAAARAAHLSQPAVTQAVARIEAALGARLLHRSYSGLELTGAGRAAAQRVDRALGMLREALGAVRTRSDDAANEDVMRGITSTQLTALIAVVEEGAFARAARRTGKSALLHHGDERRELRGGYAPHDVFVRRIVRSRAHRPERFPQHPECPVDALRGRAPRTGELEPGIAAVQETGSQGGFNPSDRLGDCGLTEVRRAGGRAHAAAPDHLIKEHEMSDVGRRAGTWARRGHVHNLLYPAVNCNYPPGRARPDNGRSRAFR